MGTPLFSADEFQWAPFRNAQQVRFSILAVIRIAFQNRRDVISKAHFVSFKIMMSIFLDSSIL